MLVLIRDGRLYVELGHVCNLASPRAASVTAAAGKTTTLPARHVARSSPPVCDGIINRFGPCVCRGGGGVVVGRN